MPKGYPDGESNTYNSDVVILSSPAATTKSTTKSLLTDATNSPSTYQSGDSYDPNSLT
eukprot:gene1688-12751_t